MDGWVQKAVVESVRVWLQVVLSSKESIYCCIGIVDAFASSRRRIKKVVRSDTWTG
jgi:hypothetical protein